MMTAGKKCGLRPTGPVDTRRVEGAIFNWCADMSWKNNPLEIAAKVAPMPCFDPGKEVRKS